MPDDPARARVLVVEDDDSLRRIAEYRLDEAGYDVVLAADGDEGLARFLDSSPDLVVTDIRMPGLGGDALADEIMRRRPGVPVVLMTGHGTVESAVAAMRRGVTDFVTKPVSWNEMLVVVQRALEQAALRRDVARLRNELRARSSFDEIVGSSPVMLQVFATMERLLNVDTTVLLEGESGTGKELVARALHYQGRRSEGPFVPVNCAAIPHDLLASELFGHERGAFTGAHGLHRGWFEQADGGTLFLDEIGDIPGDVQASLLRVLTERRVRRVGGESSVPVDVRLVAATNRDLQAAVHDGDFRQDLYYRLAVVPLRLPALRERGRDVLLLAQRFADRAAGRPVEITPGAAGALRAHAWPGNVRELENAIERAVVLGDGARIDVGDLPPGIVEDASPAPAPPVEFPEGGVDLAEIEKAWIRRALEHTGGNRTQAARLLGITRQTLLYRIEKHGIDVARPGATEDA